MESLSIHAQHQPASFGERVTAWLLASPFNQTLADSTDKMQQQPATQSAAPGFTPIPSPPGLPIVGNIFDIDTDTPLKTLEAYADQYGERVKRANMVLYQDSGWRPISIGEIFTLKLGGKELVVVSTYALVNEVCNEKRFAKQVAAALEQIRNGTGDGLFTAYTGEENWGIAHRILIPAFGPLSIRGMFDGESGWDLLLLIDLLRNVVEMADLAHQLAMKWARQGPEVHINAVDDFTRLTLDTIALCAMGARFNSFYTENMHPFVDAMVSFLVESGNRGRRLPFMNNMMSKTQEEYFKGVQYMTKVSMDLIEDRRRNPTDKKDLLNAMLLGRDPKTGKGLTDKMIVNNMITFLIAGTCDLWEWIPGCKANKVIGQGHETTSGTLSFAMHNLLRYPKCYQRLQEEVDRVIGKQKVTVEHLSQLPYMNAVLRETLRVSSPIPVIAFRPHPFDNKEEPVLLAGKYKVEHDQTIVALINKMHKDPRIYGDNANEFDPDRMYEEHFEELQKEYPNSWKPFGK
jgi:cytochrome P450 / NADPH-cytochrome P450 reductase